MNTNVVFFQTKLKSETNIINCYKPRIKITYVTKLKNNFLKAVFK